MLETETGFNAFVEMTDLVILAKTAQKITGAYKNRTGSACSYKGEFFSKMRAITRYPDLSPCLAETLLSFNPVHSAFSWAQTAGL